MGKLMMTAAALAVLALAGCDEFVIVDDPTDDYLALQDETRSLRTAIAGLPVTEAIDIPLSGSATYDGTALIALSTAAVGSELIGDAIITADFAADTIGGSMGGFYGTIAGGPVTAFDGEIVISKGLIDVIPEHDMTGKIDGTLSGGVNELVVNATLEGNFLGDPGFLNEAPEAVQLNSTPESIFTLNGGVVAGEMEVICLTD